MVGTRQNIASQQDCRCIAKNLMSKSQTNIYQKQDAQKLKCPSRKEKIQLLFIEYITDIVDYMTGQKAKMKEYESAERIKQNEISFNFDSA